MAAYCDPSQNLNVSRAGDDPTPLLLQARMCAPCESCCALLDHFLGKIVAPLVPGIGRAKLAAAIDAAPNRT
jgi:hypothetical protein